MAVELRTPYSADAEFEDLESIDAYQDWQRREGVPVVTGYYIEDLKILELAPWSRKGGRGAFVNLEGTGGVNGHARRRDRPAGSVRARAPPV
jgi:hypothetical protein